MTVAGGVPAAADHWLQWEASQLRPATFQGAAGPVAQQLAVLEQALKAAGPYLTGSTISLADVSSKLALVVRRLRCMHSSSWGYHLGLPRMCLARFSTSREAAVQLSPQAVA